MGRLRTLIDATGAALADPTDTSQVFRIAEALSLGSPERLLARFRDEAEGPLLLGRRDDILERLTDRAGLGALGPGSLGRAYLEFTEAEGITAEGLVAASMATVESPLPECDVTFVKRRMRDTHDLWHAVTGYRGDLLGEAALLAFNFAQTRHPGIGFLTGLGLALSATAEHRRFIARGYVRGRRARWLPAVDWSALLPRPLEEVRQELGVEAQGPYEEVREPMLPRFLQPG